MANMTPGQRTQMERYDLGEQDDRISRPKQGRSIVVTTVVLLLILAVLSYAAIQAFDGWAHLVVIVDLVILFFGIAYWVYPQRKNV